MELSSITGLEVDEKLNLVIVDFDYKHRFLLTLDEWEMLENKYEFDKTPLNRGEEW